MSKPEIDTYQTIAENLNEPVLFKDKKSKFLGFAFIVNNEEEVKDKISIIKKDHSNARHWCYAYQIGTEQIIYRANDDGEPKNTAGQPIYGQIQSFDLTNILVVVVRYFGGVKLGVSGLINAYKTTAKLAIETSTTITRTINIHYKIIFEYKHMNNVMRIIKEKKLDIVNQKMEADCQITISVRKKDSDSVFKTFNALHEIRIKAV